MFILLDSCVLLHTPCLSVCSHSFCVCNNYIAKPSQRIMDTMENLCRVSHCAQSLCAAYCALGDRQVVIGEEGCCHGNNI